MALIFEDLADILFATLGEIKDKGGNVVKTTSLMKRYAAGYCACLQAGLVNHLSGTVEAQSLPIGGLILFGKAFEGKTVLVPNVMTTITLQGFPPGAAAKLVLENIAVITYVMTTARISFAEGSITGIATCTPLTPGPLTLGQGIGGGFNLLVGDDCSAFVQEQTGLAGPRQDDFYTSLMNYTLNNAEVLYVPGTITGAFLMGGGPMRFGTGIGGTIV